MVLGQNICFHNRFLEALLMHFLKKFLELYKGLDLGLRS